MFKLTPITKRRLHNFRQNKRGFYSLWIFLFLYIFSLGAELYMNDRPIHISYNGESYYPFLYDYDESVFGGEKGFQTDYRNAEVQDLIESQGGVITWPLIRFHYKTINYDLTSPAPSGPDSVNWLGTDDQGRDVFARVVYGFRTSVTFALILTFLSSIIGITMGAVQGYFGGKIDLIMQRLIEVWQGLPELFILIIMAAIIEPSFGTILFILLLFRWITLEGVVRAEFLRARNFDYVRASKALGVRSGKIIFRHVLPNAMVATFTYVPFVITSSIVALTMLDFLGLGLPPGSASLGELILQGKNNLNAPWLGLTSFFTMTIMLSLMIFIGEGVRDAFDSRKIWNSSKK